MVVIDGCSLVTLVGFSVFGTWLGFSDGILLGLELGLSDGE